MNTKERPFKARLKATGILILGTVNEVPAPPPHNLHYPTMYVVDVTISNQRFKFTIINRNRCWRVDLLSVLSRQGKLRSIDSFAVENKTVEGAFEDALNALATYKNHVVDYV